MRIPVLAYHGINIAGNEYTGNDHVAFAHDLRLIRDLGLRIVPLHWVIDALRGNTQRDLSNCVALTCDDGSDFDYYDLDHPTHGPQRSLHNCLSDFVYERGVAAQPNLHLTSFVIASPEARDYLDKNCLIGRGWMNDRWWRAALQSGRIAIENHSWDHNHAAIPLPGIDGMERGTFTPCDNRTRADAEIAAATAAIDAVTAPQRTSIFCYPYGQSNAYLREEYFPQFTEAHRMRAAMGDGAAPVCNGSDIWNLPRYICGWHWKTPEELRAILSEAT